MNIAYEIPINDSGATRIVMDNGTSVLAFRERGNMSKKVRAVTKHNTPRSPHKTHMRGGSPKAPNYGAIDDALDAAEWRRQNVQRQTDRMPEAMRGVMGLTGYEGSDKKPKPTEADVHAHDRKALATADFRGRHIALVLDGTDKFNMYVDGKHEGNVIKDGDAWFLAGHGAPGKDGKPGYSDKPMPYTSGYGDPMDAARLHVHRKKNPMEHTFKSLGEIGMAFKHNTPKSPHKQHDPRTGKGKGKGEFRIDATGARIEDAVISMNKRGLVVTPQTLMVELGWHKRSAQMARAYVKQLNGMLEAGRLKKDKTGNIVSTYKVPEDLYAPGGDMSRRAKAADARGKIIGAASPYISKYPKGSW